jgi:hypothetical protein
MCAVRSPPLSQSMPTTAAVWPVKRTSGVRITPPGSAPFAGVSPGLVHGKCKGKGETFIVVAIGCDDAFEFVLTGRVHPGKGRGRDRAMRQ